MPDTVVKAPWHLWVVGVVAILFNAVGVVDFVMTMAQGSKYLAGAGMTPEQIAHYQRLPGCMTLVWAAGVFGAFGASLLLLARRRWAWSVFVGSFVAFIISLLYTYVLTPDGALMGLQMKVTSAVIATVLAVFCAYARRMVVAGVLR